MVLRETAIGFPESQPYTEQDNDFTARHRL